MRRSPSEGPEDSSVLVGCCGFPKKLSEYATTLPVVEVQQTFYKPPKVETAHRWRRAVPTSFQFTLKAWQLITHPPTSPTYRKAGVSIPSSKTAAYGFFAPSDEVEEAWQRTKEVAIALNASVVVFQCPTSFTPIREHLANLRAFFRKVDRGGLRFAWEPRGEWPEDLVGGLCRELDLIHCLDPFGPERLRTPSYGEPWYLRLHGRGGYRYQYTEEELRTLASLVRGRDAYVMFNNVFMWEDALRFLQELQKGR
ncbi:MAG: DUF72 domain-containing protein [Armatimonadota bacterium]|nr:DUF72 domain-containing protein [Armatimonadota bacterium]MDR5703933.1 DUF72 domain-containing protein [Armatimonadota bacterium]MDR7434642.1 DUF72 domain-containing protein [Armatimonadota bacterium]